MEELRKAFVDLQDLLKDSSLKGNERNEYLGYNYITLDQLKKVLAPIFKKNGILFIPEVEKVEMQTLETKDKQHEVVKQQVLVTVWLNLQFHAGGQKFSFRTAGQAIDDQGKALAKATTDALKRAFLHLFLIATEEEDEDKNYGAPQNAVKMATDSQKKAIERILAKTNIPLEKVLMEAGVETLDDLTMAKASELIQKYGNYR